MNVIGFTVAGDQSGIHGFADLTEMLGKPVQCGAIEYAASHGGADSIQLVEGIRAGIVRLHDGRFGSGRR